VTLSDRDREDYEFLTGVAATARERRLPNFLHLDQPIGIRNYIRIANEIANAVPAGRVLDWGCGVGQMTYLLRRRGFDVVPYEILATADGLPVLPVLRHDEIVSGVHPTDLPFDEAEFDAVLSCGVLEHVDEFSASGNERRSLAEINRVLRSSGYFAIYQLPQKYTWVEAITRTLRIGYSHPRRFTAAEIEGILGATGFSVERLRRGNMLPKNLTGFPDAFRRLYSGWSDAILAADRALSSVPLLNQLAGVLEIIARKASSRTAA
jgi:SAM-dependent methyltransferase